MKVNIELMSMYKRIVVETNSDNNVFLCNKKPVTNILLKQFEERLLDIVIYWEQNTIKNYYVDLETVRVEIEKDGEFFEYFIQGIYPDNYNEFINLLEGLEYGQMYL
ncbi:MAG: hypothetical protein IJX17_04720 [Clostridia bacterium]|nr:hypothetical protein [Clostridia bacterium]